MSNLLFNFLPNFSFTSLETFTKKEQITNSDPRNSISLDNYYYLRKELIYKVILALGMTMYFEEIDFHRMKNWKTKFAHIGHVLYKPGSYYLKFFGNQFFGISHQRFIYKDEKSKIFFLEFLCGYFMGKAFYSGPPPNKIDTFLKYMNNPSFKTSIHSSLTLSIHWGLYFTLISYLNKPIGAELYLYYGIKTLISFFTSLMGVINFHFAWRLILFVREVRQMGEDIQVKKISMLGIKNSIYRLILTYRISKFYIFSNAITTLLLESNNLI